MARPVSGEVLEGTSRAERFHAAEARIRRVTHLLDDLVPIPGTGQKVGLDPVIGLIPVVGDVTANGNLIAGAQSIRRGRRCAWRCRRAMNSASRRESLPACHCFSPTRPTESMPAQFFDSSDTRASR